MWKFEVNSKQVYISWLKGTLAPWPAAQRHLSGFLPSIDTIKALKNLLSPYSYKISITYIFISWMQWSGLIHWLFVSQWGTAGIPPAPASSRGSILWSQGQDPPVSPALPLSTNRGCQARVPPVHPPESALTSGVCRGFSAAGLKSSEQTLMSYAKLTDTPVESPFASAPPMQTFR